MNIMALDDEKAKGYVALNGFFGICREWGGYQAEIIHTSIRRCRT